MYMFENPRLVQAFASGFAFFICGLLSLFLFTARRDDRSARTFAFALVAIATWGLFGFFFEIVSPEKLELARVLRIISVTFIVILTISVNNFARVFYKEHMNKKNVAHSVMFYASCVASSFITLLLLMDLFTHSGFVVKGVILAANGALEPIPGPFFHAVYGYFFIGLLLTGYLLWTSRNANFPFIKNQVTWMLISIGVGFVAGGSRFATWYGINGPPVLASLAAPIFGIGFFYAIVKHHLFNIRVIATEIFTFSIWGFLFLLVIFSDTLQERVINSILLLSIVILGAFLIRGTFREVEQKEELKKANNALTNLNQNLEEIVRERTRELNQAKLHTDAIIENMTLGLVEYNEDFTIIKVNRAAEELLGFSRDDVLHKKVSGSDVQNENLSSLAEVLYFDPEQTKVSGESGIGSRSEISITHPQKRDLQVITFAISPESETVGNETQRVKIIRDITREKLIEKNKSDFITIVAHQLRTPLSAIKWVFNMALEKQTDVNKDHAEALKDGSQETEQMIHLINDILNLGNFEEARFGYEFKQSDIVKIITDAADRVRTRASWKGVSLETILPETLIAPFVFDPERISLALLNIIENAVNYTQKGGFVKIAVEQDNSMIKIIVKDNGIGIPAEDLSKLPTTKFFRSVKAVRTETDGSGLGLFITNNIIESHKGSMMIESKEDTGTTITLAIPLTLSTDDTPRTRAQATNLG